MEMTLSGKSKRKYTMSERALDQRQQAARKHSIYAFSDRGVEALSADNVNSLNDLRELVKTHPGRE